MSAPTASAAAVLSRLREELTCPVLGPDHEGYDAARVVVAGSVDARPAAIIRPTSDADVAAAIAAARGTGLRLAVRGGGHSGAGHSTAEGGVVIDLRDMTAIEVDADRRTAWVESGCTAGEVTTALAKHGLAVGFGDTGSVGIGGITLGGGVGYLSRKHGLTIDSLLAADLVTADGEVRRVDETTDPDLFWAIRGGGGNFGIVTRFHYRLQPVDQVVGGMLVLPATVETVVGFIAAAEAAPTDLTTIANVMNCPPLPFVAEEHHGSLVIFAILCWAGETEAGLEAVAPFTALTEPLANLVRPMPYAEIYPPEDPGYRPLAVSRTMFVDEVGSAEAALILERLAASDAPVRAVQLRVLGGAIADVPADATAYAHRASRIMVNIASFYGGPQDLPMRQAWVEGLALGLQQRDTGAYVNFLADEGPERIRAAYPGSTWDRLAAVKAVHDPDNIFSRNQNVPPAPGAVPSQRGT
jgi:hypothetical protein